jgi:tetratricopeptide (TPR) repeat protein
MSSNEIIERLIVDASTDPLNPEKNLAIAVEYEKLGQTASAVGFYLRAAEYGYETDGLTTYAALLRVSICIEGQKDRGLTVSNVLLQAIAYAPNRPEAYLLMSRFYEKSGAWQESYTFALIGLMHSRVIWDLPVDVGYPDYWALEFQQAVAAWWIGRRNESLEMLRDLSTNKFVTEKYAAAIAENLARLDSNETDV